MISALCIAISHRDMASRNIFIHYRNRGIGLEPAVGLEANAFPDIVVGDFGSAALESDDPEAIPYGIFETDEVNEWEDIYAMSKSVRQLCQTHIPVTDMDDDWGERPECYLMSSVNGYLDPADTPYSNDLITFLQNFEWPNCDVVTDPLAPQFNADGLLQSSCFFQPDAEWVADTMLPLARQKVEEYRNPAGGLLPTHYKTYDVSWTKPERLMPFEYEAQYARSNDGMDDDDDEDDEDDDVARKYLQP